MLVTRFATRAVPVTTVTGILTRPVFEITSRLVLADLIVGLLVKYRTRLVNRTILIILVSIRLIGSK